MKKALVIMLVMAAPLYAGTITFTDAGGGVLNWSADVAIVAMGLDVDSDVPITGVAVDSFFDVYMDAAHDEEAGDGYTYGEGTPIANQDVVGQTTLPAAEFAISMGGLGETAPADAPTSGSITFTAGSTGTATICGNSLRGGVVDDTGAAVTIAGDCVTVAVGGCFDPGHPDYAAWIAAGSPECWCYMHQCQGDSDGLQQGSTKVGYYWVGTDDLNLLSSAWEVKEGTFGSGIASIPNGICADFARDIQGSTKVGYYYVGTEDLNILSANWEIKDPTFGTGLPDNTCGGSL